MSCTEVPLLPELRRSTQTRHARIEALLRLDATLGPGALSLGRYAAVLQGFHEFLSRWEPCVAAALPPRLRPWFAPRRRAAFAAQDIAFLRGRVASAGPGAARPLNACSPALATAARRAVAALALQRADVATLFGALYVIEGSALGGQVITPRLRPLGLAPGAGASYFHGFGERTGGMWREFRARAEDEVGGSDGAVAAACDGAQRTFDALIDSFAPIAEVAPVTEAASSAPSAA